MSAEQTVKRKLESQINEIEKHLDLSFDKINNFIDQVFMIDYRISKLNTQKLELSLPKVDQLDLIGQSQFLSNIVEEVKPLIKYKIKDQVQIQLLQDYQSLIQSQQSKQQLKHQKLNQIKSPSQFNTKLFTYQIIQSNSIKQSEYYGAVAINKDCSIVAAGCYNQIKIYEFKQGILKLNQLLNEHKSQVLALNFMKQSIQLISGDMDGYILIWSYNNNSWNISQTIKEHSDYIRCLILNNNEDLFISCSDDHTIKFWVKQNEWICQQTISDHYDYVYQISLNELQNQLISCGRDGLILVIEYSECNKKWIVIQKIQVDCLGYRLCFINDNQFTFQPFKGNLMHVYEMNSVSKQFTKTKDITLNQGDEGYALFPQQFIRQKQLLVNKHDKYINLIRKTQNSEFKVEQSIQFSTNKLFGQLSDDGEYLITWDDSSCELQIRRYTEE